MGSKVQCQQPEVCPCKMLQSGNEQMEVYTCFNMLQPGNEQSRMYPPCLIEVKQKASEKDICAFQSGLNLGSFGA